MKMKKQNLVGKTAVLSALALAAPSALALDQIIKPYQSARSSGMGGVKLTTGLYDENFFGNPARVTDNPKWKITVLDPMVEFNSETPNTISDLTGSGDTIQKIGNTAGKNQHVRTQFTMPAVYLPTGEDGQWAFAFAWLSSVQADVNIRRDYAITPQAIVDTGPAFTVGRTFLENEELSVGITPHLTYRLAADPGFTLADLIKGRSLSPRKSGGQGTHLDFDIGGTYWLPWTVGEDGHIQVGAAINNLFGGNYSNIGFHPINDLPNKPMAQPRTYGFGGSLNYEELYVLGATSVALELQDIGNNPNGSWLRTLHIGGETHYGVLAGRLGLNQGYIAGGLGLDLKAVTLDVSTYAEEMSLNVGGFADRRYAFRLAFEI